MFSLYLLFQVPKGEKIISHDFVGQQTPIVTVPFANTLFASNQMVTISIHLDKVGLKENGMIK